MNTLHLYQTVIKTRYFYLTDSKKWQVLNRNSKGKLKRNSGYLERQLVLATWNSPRNMGILEDHLRPAEMDKFRRNHPEMFI